MRHIDPNELQRKQIVIEQAKSVDDGNGTIAGYGSVFGNKDLGGDIVVRGAFTKTLSAFVRDGFIAEGHNWGNLGVAYVRSAREDDYGLWLEAEFHSDPDSQKVRTKVRERITAQKSVGLSIGYFVKDYKREGDALLLTEIELKEVSIVTVPMNPLAMVAGVKSANLTLEDEASMVASAMKSYIERLKGKGEAREKESRTLSSETLSHWDKVRAAVEEMDAYVQKHRKSGASEEQMLKDFMTERMRFEQLVTSQYN